jgi:type IV pilus biogenesis protein PilP
MSPRNESPFPVRAARRAVAARAARAARAIGRLAVVLCAGAAAAPAQTIADFSRSQRAVLEATMTQNAARAAAVAPSAASATSAVPGSPPSMPSAAAVPPRGPLRAPEPVLRVSGVFASERRTMAEVAVDGAVWLVEAGQVVPGTRWRVGSIASDRVVLDRPAARDDAGPVASATRTFVLAVAR